MKILARLNAKTQDYELVVGGFGGLSQFEIASALKGLTPLEDAIVRTKYVSTINIKYLISELDKFLKIKDDYRVGFAEAVAHELTGEHRCTKCQGRKMIIRTKLPRDCDSCNGTGKKLPSYSSIAKKCGMSKQSFLDNYKSKYLKYLLKLQSIEAYALSKVSRNLTD